jgi:Mn-dependent DtxR family transcriptional regulator
MKLLREDGYIAMDRYGTVSLLEKGSEIAERIYERHTILSQMLESLGVDPEVARADACKIEHDISEESFERIKKHFKERVAHEEVN